MIDTLKDFIVKEWRSIAAHAVRPPSVIGEPSQRNEAELIERATTGLAAKAFLESAEVTDFMAQAKANLTRALLSLPLEADKERRNLAVAIQTVDQLMHYLTALAASSVSAERELQRMADGKQPKPFF